MKKLTAIFLTVVMLFTCLSDTAIAAGYYSEAAGTGPVEVIYDIPIFAMYGYLDSHHAIAITLPNNFGAPQDVTDSIRWDIYYAGSKFKLKPGEPYKALEEPEFNPYAKGGYVDEQLICFGALTRNYSGDGLWTTLPIQNQYGSVTSIRIKATFNIKGGINNSSINNIDSHSYLQLVDSETYEPVIGSTVYGPDWKATVREHHEGNFHPVTGTTHSGYCNLCGKIITEDCMFSGGFCEWCLQEERFTPVYWEPKDSELPNMSAANEAVLSVKLNKPIVGMAEYTLYAKASADVSDNWFNVPSERVFVDTVSVDGTASELNFRVPAEYINSGCEFAAFENIMLLNQDVMVDYMHVDRTKVGNEAGSSGRLSWKAAGDDRAYYDGFPINYTKIGAAYLNMGADVEAIQYSLTADTSGTYYRLNPVNGTVNFGTPTSDGTRIGFNSISVTFDSNKIVVRGGKFSSQHYAKLDYSKGSISIYKFPGECIWKSKGYSFEGEDPFDTDITAYDNRLCISPINSYIMLEYNAEYYVVIDPGVITFEDGTSFEGIKKGRWTFKTLTEAEDHEHVSAVWKNDKDSHWHICEICGRKYGTEGHKLDSNCRCTVCDKTSHTASPDRRNVKAATCTEQGYTGEGYCVKCFVTIDKGKNTPALGHNTHWVGNSNNPYHWNRCYRCNRNVSQELHTFENGKCTVCGVRDPSILQSPEGFVKTAWKYVGYTGREMHDLFGLNSGHYTGSGSWSKDAWCDRFVYFVARECGLDGAISSSSLGNQASLGRAVNSPQPGDLVFFDWKNGGGIDHVGIVCEVNGDEFGVVHGNYHVSSEDQGVVCGPNNTSLGRSCKFKHGGINYTDYWNVGCKKLENLLESTGTTYLKAKPPQQQ